MIFTEVIKVKDGSYCNLIAHLERLSRTAKNFFGCEIDLLQISENLIPENMRSGVVKCRIVYSDHLLSVDFSQYTYRNISKLAIVNNDEIDYCYKFQDRSALNSLLELRGDADEILIVKNGLITDTSFTNVLFRDYNGDFFTPNSYLLSGTKRQLLLDKGVVKERSITVDDIDKYTEIYLINAMIDIEDNITLPVGYIQRSCV